MNAKLNTDKLAELLQQALPEQTLSEFCTQGSSLEKDFMRPVLSDKPVDFENIDFRHIKLTDIDCVMETLSAYLCARRDLRKFYNGLAQCGYAASTERGFC